MKKLTGILMMSMLSLIIGCSNSTKIEDFKKFGQEPFTVDGWGSSKSEQRAAMLYSYLDINKPVTALTRDKVLADLGSSTAYYEYDEFPAYQIANNGLKYTVGFVVDHNTGKVKAVVLEDGSTSN